MIKINFQSNYYITFDDKWQNVDHIRNQSVVSVGCSQSIRVLSGVGKVMMFMPVALLEEEEISISDINLYTDFANRWAKTMNCQVSYLGTEVVPLIPAHTGYSMTIKSNCHIFLIENDPTAAPPFYRKYRWDLYLLFVLMRQLYIHYAYFYGKSLIEILRNPEKYPVKTFEDHIITSVILANVWVKEGRSFGQLRPQSFASRGNSILSLARGVARDWVKLLKLAEHENNMGRILVNATYEVEGSLFSYDKDRFTTIVEMFSQGKHQEALNQFYK